MTALELRCGARRATEVCGQGRTDGGQDEARFGPQRMTRLRFRARLCYSQPT